MQKKRYKMHYLIKKQQKQGNKKNNRSLYTEHPRHKLGESRKAIALFGNNAKRSKNHYSNRRISAGQAGKKLYKTAQFAKNGFRPILA
ncbi:MAG: hypothetical protein IIZ45_06760 [Firmicutes bacterium]|nr:hypothetical protein [Bacillota bacterium]